MFYYLSESIAMLFLRLLSHLPLFCLYIISDFLFVGVYYVIRYRRKLVMKNLTNSFPEKSKEELAKIARQFYHNLCDYGVESLKLLTIGEEELKRRFCFENEGPVYDYAKQNQSVIYLAAHQFNWEWGMVSASTSLPLKVDFVYQKVKNDFFNALMLVCRTRFGAYAIERKRVAREAVSRRHILRGIATVSDQYPGSSKNKRFMHLFMNQETAFFYGANQLAQLTQYPVLFFNIQKLKRGYYKGSFAEIGTPPYHKNDTHVIENYIKVLEEEISKNPEAYLWSHNRWKKKHVTSA